jgi:hypothetical protein
MQRVEAHDDRRVRGNRAPIAQLVPRIRERTRARGEALIDRVPYLDE